MPNFGRRVATKKGGRVGDPLRERPEMVERYEDKSPDMFSGKVPMEGHLG